MNETQTSTGPRKHNGVDHQASPEEIERSLAKTRADLNETLRAIEHRLSPGELVDQAIDYFQGGPREFAQNLGAQVRDNPMPVALMAIGIGWMMMGNRGGSSYSGPDYTSEGIAESGTGLLERGRSSYAGASESLHRTGEGLGQKSAEMKERAQAKMAEAREGMGRASESVRSRARTMAAGVRRGSEKTASGIRYSSEKARDSFSYLLHEQPLVLGMLGVALGALIGSGLPTTRREHEALAPARDAMNRVRETGREQMEKAREDLKQAASEPPPSPSGSPV